MTAYTRSFSATLAEFPKIVRAGTGIGTRFYYSMGGTPEQWREENARIGLTISDSIAGRTRLMSVLISNPRNIKESIYTPYLRVKLVEYLTGLTIFLGRLEFSEPIWDRDYGQLLKVTARDYSYELFERKVSSDYSGAPHKRSAVITHLIEDYRYNSSSITTNIEVSGSSDTIARNYTKTGRLPMEIVEELAKEDPWTDATWSGAGKVWTYIGSTWTDKTTDADDPGVADVPLMNGISDYLYLGQNNPFIGANFTLSTPTVNYGTITWQYWSGSWTALTKLNNYDFEATGEEKWALPSDWTTTSVNSITKYWVRCYVSTISTQAVASVIACIRGFGYDYYVNDSQVFQYFRRCSKPTGGPSVNGLTIALGEAQTTSKKAMMQDYSFSDSPAEIVTRVTVYGTDSTGTAVSYTETDSTLEASLEVIKAKEEFVWGAEMTNAALLIYCTNRAKALMSYKGTETLIRGEFRTPRYPYFGVAGSETLVRVGDLIHIHCSPRSINDDYLVLEVNYEEPSSITKIKILSNIYGRSYSPFETTSILQGLRSGADLIVSSAKISDLIVGNAMIGSLDASKITSGDIATDRLTANAANGVNGGVLNISASRINISGSTTFSSGYDPTVKTTTFVQTSIPTSLKAGDLWIDTDDYNKIYRADTAGATIIAVGQWVLTSDLTTKTTLFQQAKASIPTSTAIGDLWVTTDGNETYRAGMIGANEITAGEWVLVNQATAINTGVTTISGGKITTNTLSADAIMTSSLTSKVITLAGTNCYFNSGKTAFNNTQTGFILGLDGSTPKFYIGTTTKYLNWDGTDLTVTGKILAGANSEVISGQTLTINGLISDGLTNGLRLSNAGLDLGTYSGGAYCKAAAYSFYYSGSIGPNLTAYSTTSITSSGDLRSAVNYGVYGNIILANNTYITQQGSTFFAWDGATLWIGVYTSAGLKYIHS